MYFLLMRTRAYLKITGSVNFISNVLAGTTGFNNYVLSHSIILNYKLIEATLLGTLRKKKYKEKKVFLAAVARTCK